MVKLGGHVVVITPAPVDCYIDTGQREYSGIGKNRHTTRMVKEQSLLEAIPAEFAARPATGTALQFVGPPAFASFWKANRPALVYRAVFVQFPGKAVLEVSGTSNFVASCLVNPGGGALVLMPDVFGWLPEPDSAS